MNLSKTQALELAKALREDAEHHKDVANSVDMRPQDTVNWDHAQNALKAAAFIESAIASKDSDLVTRWAKSQAHELMGIQADTEQGGAGFDEVCRKTLSRVIRALSEGPKEENTHIKPRRVPDEKR